jgi:hypothetical protein
MDMNRGTKRKRGSVKPHQPKVASLSSEAFHPLALTEGYLQTQAPLTAEQILPGKLVRKLFSSS